jgi:hypothetical protein
MMQQKDFLKFSRNLVFFIILLFLGDRLIGFGLRTLFFSLKKGQYAQMTYSIDTAKPEILILGSSRALHHYSSSVIEQKLGKTVYNSGRDGQFIPYYCAVEDVVLNRKKPELIILDVNVWDLAPNNEKYEKLSMLLPYVSEHKELKKYTNVISKWENIKLYCETYLYNSTLLVSVHDHLFPDKLPQDDNGYFPLVRTMDKSSFDSYKVSKKLYDEKRAKQNIPLDIKVVDYYIQFLKKTRSQNIKTYVIISPTILHEPLIKERILLGNIAKQFKNVVFLDYSTDSTYNNHYEMFADELHLNNIGAEKFSADLTKVLSLK